MRYRTLDTPVGPLSIIVHDRTLLGAAFESDPSSLLSRAGIVDASPARESGNEEIEEAIASYFSGDLGALDRIAVQQPGTPLKQRMWQALREIPAGQTASYADVAAKAGSPKAARAAGTACASNLIALVVPCHRVVASSGALGGYYYGLDMKRSLLLHERQPVRSTGTHETNASTVGG